ncbi:MAG: DsbE family thiol:disulfide interchange protein [Beijerinckiaceae bacterium]|jgi:cytochrome c biogenesis protein CcmG/thiol:disulfide interchange protein DsbE|nr:DsbE family thiol:disulfide interchange protein [Beijerinckiaceae bacterium]
MSEADITARPRRNWLYLAPLAFFALLALLFLFRLFAGDASRVPSALIGKPAPNLTLPSLEGLLRDGRPVPGIAPADLRDGRVTILNVFASWCAPCRVEHPFLVEMAGHEAVRSGRVQVMGLNYKDEPENARRFLGALGNPYAAVGTDRTGRSSIEWGVYGVPETFLVGKDGTILKKHIGQLTEESARALLADAVAAAR